MLRTFLDNAPRNARYTTKTIQNELIEICGNYVREVTNSAVYNSGYFAVIADEVTDSSNNHSVLGVCNRMLDTGDPNNPVVKEAFLCSLKELTQRLYAQSLLSTIHHVILT